MKTLAVIALLLALLNPFLIVIRFGQLRRRLSDVDRPLHDKLFEWANWLGVGHPESRALRQFIANREFEKYPDDVVRYRGEQLRKSFILQLAFFATAFVFFAVGSLVEG